MGPSAYSPSHQTRSHNGQAPHVSDAHDERLQRAVLRTVAYSDVFDYPLTTLEIHRYLMGYTAPIEVIRETLSHGDLVRQRLDQENGYYTLPGRSEIVPIRHERESAARELWPIALSYGRIISDLPFVRMLAITGELAVNNINGQSDVDYFIVTEPGRLWLTRAMVILVVKAAARRGVTVCPNYLVSENVLTMAQRNLYTAREMAQMVPLYGMDIYRRMRQENAWVSEFLPNADGPPLRFETESRDRRGRKLAESLLRTKVGERLEHWEMTRKIEKLTRTHEPDDEVAFSPDWCKGHFDGHGHRTLEAFAERVRAVEGHEQ